jgi:hypothetical protein
MRLVPMPVAAALILACAGPALGQEWDEYVSLEDGFSLNFPAEPTVTETTYASEYGADLPARVYSVVQGDQSYTMTVVDYSPVERLLTEKAEECPPFADERCTGFGAGPIVGAGYWRTDIRGALVWASWQFMQRDVEVTDYLWNFVELVEGHQLQLTSNVDQSRSFVSIYMHEDRLYIMEGKVPAGYPEPGLFQQSLGFVDEDGNRVRYGDYYDNDYAPPERVPRGVATGHVIGGSESRGR